MKTRIKSRVETSLLKPPQAKHLSEKEKRALELSGEVEHEDGEAREENAREVQNSQ